MAYEAQPGSVAYRAIAFLETLQTGSEIAGASLAAHINTEPANLSANLAHAKLNGGVFSRQKGGHPKSPMFWSLTDHSALATTPSELNVPRFQGWSGLPNPLMPVDIVRTHKFDTTGGSKTVHEVRVNEDATLMVCDHGVPIDGECDECEHAPPKPVEKPEVVISDKSFWLGSDGALHIGRPLGGVELSPAETGALYGFLHRCREVLA